MNLAAQLFTSALLVLVMTLVHGAGVAVIAHILGLDRPADAARPSAPRVMLVLSAVALLLFALHMIEVAMYAAFYMAIGAFAGFEDALFHSASAYTTLSQPVADFPVEWRLVGALEGLIGFLLIGWSTAFFVTDMNRLLRSPRPD